MKKIIVLLSCGLLAGLVLRAQESTKTSAAAPLYDTVVKLDSALFRAFNTRDTASFNAFFTIDLEFYHDQGGLTGYQHTIDFLRSNIEQHSDLHREAVAGSFEVYPINGYGAIQIGQHRFCHTENGKQICGTFKFIHIWKNENNTWKIARVISYDH